MFMATTGSTPEEGWYPDPSGSGQRWWDGANWTQHHRNSESDGDITATHGVAGGGTQPAIDPVVIGSGVGGFLLLLSLIVPWASGANLSFNAFSGDVPWFLTGAGFDVDDAGFLLTDTISRALLAHGWLLLLVAAAVIYVAWAHFNGADWTGNAFLGLGGFVVVLSLINAFAINSAFGGITQSGTRAAPVPVDIGASWGVIIAVLAGILIAAAGMLVLARQQREAADFG